PSVPDWAADAVFYQIFPERFRNGDPSNDPTRESLEHPVPSVPENWAVKSWTSDWYEQDDWERQIGGFYDTGQGAAHPRGAVFDRRYGGDLQGVIDKLDYLADLGINAIYFNPVFYARSLHKYDGNTFHHIDPHFGPDPQGDFELMGRETSDPSTWNVTAADQLFFDLLDAAHERSIRVIIDGVWNHTGRDFFAFENIRENQQQSDYVDWYIVESFDDAATPENEFRYKGWWGVQSLPEFADSEDGTDLHPGPKEYVFDATTRWMDPNGDGDPSDGIDGWRLDVTNEVPIAFWRDWNTHVRSINPDAYTVTEIWENAKEMIEKGGFSATMNYWGFAFPVNGYLVDGASEPSQFVATLEERRETYSDDVQYALQNLIDSHDTDRLASMIVNRERRPYESPERFDYDWGSTASPRHNDWYDVSAPDETGKQVQKLVALFQMTYVGPPMVYYGTEAGMWGADDPDDRKPMVWEDLSFEDERAAPPGHTRDPDPVQFDRDLFDFYRDVVRLRKDNEPLRRGDFQVLNADDERDILVFSRTLDGRTIVVALNRSDEAHSLRTELPEALRKQFGLLFSTHEEGYRIQQDGTGLLLEMPELSGLVLIEQ
ncbi:MAG: glycoside hydrolase family 13 protein, partial [Rhodothermales bacterium]